MSVPGNTNALWSADDEERVCLEVLDVVQRIARFAPTGYPLIPRIPEWEKAVADGIVW